MLELRLIDPNGYTVNRSTAVTKTLPENADAIEARMRTKDAGIDAANWDMDVRDYTVQRTELPRTAGFDITDARERVYDAMDDADGPIGIADGVTSLADLRIAEAAAGGVDLNALDPASGRAA